MKRLNPRKMSIASSFQRALTWVCLKGEPPKLASAAFSFPFCQPLTIPTHPPPPPPRNPGVCEAAPAPMPIFSLGRHSARRGERVPEVGHIHDQLKSWSQPFNMIPLVHPGGSAKIYTLCLVIFECPTWHLLQGLNRESSFDSRSDQENSTREGRFLNTFLGLEWTMQALGSLDLFLFFLRDTCKPTLCVLGSHATSHAT